MTRYTLTADPTLSVEVISADLARCTLEIEAALHSGAFTLSDPRGVGPSVIVIAGTVTDVLAPNIVDLILAHPGAKAMSFGACATSGGPYWDSPPVSKGIDHFLK